MMENSQKIPGAVYLAAEGFSEKLAEELGDITWHEGRVFYSEDKIYQPVWAEDIWWGGQKFTFATQSQAVRFILSLGKLWQPFPIQDFRRSELIQEKLPALKIQKIKFGESFKKIIGTWFLKNRHEVWVFPKRWKKYPFGKLQFIEDKITPPNRAYLKLWEILTLMESAPAPHEKVFDLGASPGGWTWVLANLGVHVTAIDKSPLEPEIQKLPNVKFEPGSAFSMQPNDFKESVDWIFSDVICYPERLLTFVKRWIDSGKVKNMVTTVKLQGKTDKESIRAFREIPDSQILHLHHNKHELTWVWPARVALVMNV